MKRTDTCALVSSVKKAWAVRGNTTRSDHVTSKAWGRLRNAPVLIVKGGGSNDLVEKKRGRRFKNLDMPQDFLMCDDPQHQNEAAGVSDNEPLCFDPIVDEEDNDGDDETVYRI